MAPMTLAAKLRTWQHDLIDMSRLNKLLYFTPGKTSIQLLDDQDRLFAQLAHTARAYALDPDRTDDPADCERRLTRLRARAREALNDRGTHVLYVSFGQLAWRESPASDEIISSPLVLVPVTLTRDGVLGRFHLTRTGDEEIEINPTLREKLRNDFAIELPSFAAIAEQGEGEAEGERRKLRLPEVFSAITAVLSRAQSTTVAWGITAESHLGIFSFHKLVMYQDLARHADEIAAHPILRALGGEARTPPEPPDLVTTRDLDRRLRPHDSFEILDADSSQQEAIAAAAAGVSFVLQGPPGTGKSQTIANIIAERLGGGKRVLFVSEKMAALEVVRQRLRDAGLDEFCLDLHSQKVDKKAFIAEVARVLAAAEMGRLDASPEAAWQMKSDTLLDTRIRLNAYVHALHAPRPPLGISAFTAYAELARLAATADMDAALPGVPNATRADQERPRAALAALMDTADVLDAIDSYPWHDTLAGDYSLELEANIRHHFGRLADALARLEALGAALRETLDEPDAALTPAWLDAAAWRALALAASPIPPIIWLEPGRLDVIRRAAADAHARATRHHAERATFDTRYAPAMLALDHADLRRRLSDAVAPLAAQVRPREDDHGDPRDVLPRERDALDTHLREGAATLERAHAQAAALAARCGLPAAATLRDVDALLDTADCLLDTPAPPAHWLDADAFAAVRAAVLDAGERSARRDQQRATLAAIYEPALLDLDIPALAARFRDQYHSPLRYLLPAYYGDLAQVRAQLREGQTRTQSQVRGDVALAEKLLAGEDWLRERRAEHAHALGRLYTGDETDWTHARAVVDWADRLHQLYAGPIPAEAAALVTGPARDLAPLRALRDQLRQTWDAWRVHAAYLDGMFAPAAFLPDAAAFATDLANADPSTLARALTATHVTLTAFWSARDELARHRLAPTVDHSGVATLCDDLDRAAEIARAEAWFADQDGALAEAFGRFHAGLTTDWRALFAALEWAGAYLALYGGAAVPAGARLLACDTEAGAAREQTGARGGEMTALLADVRAEIAFARGVLPERALIAPAATADDATVSALRERVVFHLENLHCLERWLRCARQRALCAGLGLGGLLDAALRERPFPRDLVARFDKRFYQLWLDAVLRQAPELQSFAGEAHEQTIQRFRDLDEDHIRQAQRRTHARLAERRRAGILAVRGDTMGALAWAFTALRKEVAKKRHPSIRQIVRATGPALLTLKPCWMMSPLSVSQFMDTAEPLFDVVIFDEASQVCPEDAICAILRGAQLIVVGDPKQLPPTRFFAKSLGDDEDEDDEDGATAEASARAERTESILNECLGVDFPQRRLRWHYRSRHESLIAFSNAHFYDDNLYTFPSPDARHDDGVRFVHVADGVYDRGGRRTNVREAQRVVDLVVEHFQRYSTDRSLGVVALSRAQEDAIRDEITARRKRDRTLDGWGDELDENNDGGFFVKNLESVQGDERDVIILSIGYGRDATGRSPSTNFGPVNKAGGERRLNVAVTRAKHQLVVVSSMRADDLPAGLSNPGARTLRAYLEYAERGPNVLPAQTRASAMRAATVGAAPESPFEAAVYAALSAKGLALDCQVGCSGYRIDLAVRDPRQPGRYLLGIECDGATYHSSATARDRDRLRQRHLERMGWHIHRIWSRDWVRDPAREVARVVAAVEEAQVDGVAYLEPVAVAAGGASASRPRIVTADGTDPGVPRGTLPPLPTPQHPTLRLQPTPSQSPTVPRPTRPPSMRLVSVDGQTTAARTCETCAFFQEETSTRFYCGRKAVYLSRDPSGKTPACPMWRRLPHDTASSV